MKGLLMMNTLWSDNRMGLALTAVWSKAPPLTARCLSPLHGFESQTGHVRKLPVTWGLASHELATIGINVTKNKIPNY